MGNCKDQKTNDGLKLVVRWYDNNGCLKQVSDKPGVSIAELKKWLDGVACLDTNHKRKLEQLIKPPIKENLEHTGICKVCGPMYCMCHEHR